MKLINVILEDIVLELKVVEEITELSNLEQNRLNNQVFERWLAHAHRENALRPAVK